MKDPVTEALSKCIIAYAFALCAENKTEEEIIIALQKKGLPEDISTMVALNIYAAYLEGLMKYKTAIC